MHYIDNDITEFHKCLLAFQDKAFYAPASGGLSEPLFTVEDRKDT